MSEPLRLRADAARNRDKLIAMARRQVDGELEVESDVLGGHRQLGMTRSPLGFMRATSKLIVRGRLVPKENHS